MRRLSYSRTEGVLALALLIVAIAAVSATLLGPPLRTWLAREEQIAGAEERLEAFRGRARDLKALEIARDALAEQDLRAQGLITAETRDLAAAELQTVIRRLSAQSNGAISTMRPETTEGDPRLTVVDARMTIPADAVTEFLTNVENARPLVFIEKFEIRAAPGRGGVNGAAGALNAQIRAAAYFAPGAAR